MSNNKITHCQNCGAPATTEICSYCKGISGIDKNYIKLEYPALECNETNISFHTVAYPIIAGVTFGLLALLVIGNGITASNLLAILIGIAIAVFACLFINIGLTPVIRFDTLEKNGKITEAIVYGYMKDEFIINGKPTEIVKLLIDTKEGKRFILYQLEDTKQPYKLKSKVRIKVYKDIYQILDKQHYYFD